MMMRIESGGGVNLELWVVVVLVGVCGSDPIDSITTTTVGTLRYEFGKGNGLTTIRQWAKNFL